MFEQELNKYWKTVINTIQDALMVVDKTGTIVFVNRAFETITGYTHNEAIGQLCMLINCDICKIARQTPDGIWCELFQKGELNMKKCRLTRKDGKGVHVIKNASLLHDMSGKVMGAVETLTDLTEILRKDSQIHALRDVLRQENGFQGMLGTSAAMQGVFEMITNAANSDAPVIILGESGTGKELVAKAIHDLGPRSLNPFIKVNCAALNESLLETELFGHVKGAYTGAHQNRTGRFEAARSGDIFLDEIGDIPLITQVKLLRVLEENAIERVGDHRPIPVDVRVITATHKDLDNLVKNREFREDFYYRINVIPIHIPPLRERPEDIPILADDFLRRVQLKNGKEIHAIDDEAMRLLTSYPWPGNIRELKSAFEYAAVSCQESVIKPHHFPPSLLQGKRIQSKTKPPPVDRNLMKRKQLLEALKQADGNQSEAARILGVSRVTVWNRMKRFNIKFQYEINS